MGLWEEKEDTYHNVLSHDNTALILFGLGMGGLIGHCAVFFVMGNDICTRRTQEEQEKRDLGRGHAYALNLHLPRARTERTHFGYEETFWEGSALAAELDGGTFLSFMSDAVHCCF